MVCLQLRGFSKEDFLPSIIPAGSLGKQLLLKIEDIMHTDSGFAQVTESATIQESLLAMTQAKCGSIAVVEAVRGVLKGDFY